MRRLTLLGHPLHPPLVHFPMALLPVSFAAQAWDLFIGNPTAASLAAMTLSLGLIIAVPAVIAGFLDYLSISSGHSGERAAQLHLGVMAAAITAYFAAWLLERQSPQSGAMWASFACSGLGTVALLAGGWLGGHMVYRHGVGQG